jgi:hypothetical protein
MPPMSPENAALQQMIAEASAHLRAQIRQEIAALRQAVDESQQLVQMLQRDRGAPARLQRGKRASEIGASHAHPIRSPLPITR